MDDVDRAHRARLGHDFVQKAQQRLLVRDRDVDADELGAGPHGVQKIASSAGFTSVAE